MRSYIQIFFARPPYPGHGKRRLAYFLGEQLSCQLYRKILLKVLRSFASCKDSQEHYLRLYMSKKAPLFSELCPEIASEDIFYQARENNLGKRLMDAFLETAQQTKEELPIIIAGTDYPCYGPKHAAEAISLLSKADVVLGPAYDGGYYCIALRRKWAADKALLRQAFASMTWSHPQVLQEQMRRFQDAGLQAALAKEKLHDIDDIHSLLAYEAHIRARKSRLSQAPSQKRKTKEEGLLSLAEFVPDIRAILPVWNEEENLRDILSKLQESGLFREIICADNGSTDASAAIAKSMGISVTHCQQRGYGATCLQAIDSIKEQGGCDVVLFLDADGSDDLSYVPEILAHCVSGASDFVLGARVSALAEKGALLAHARFGNWLSVSLIRLFWSFSYKDLGPLRAISWQALQSLEMDDKNFGWTVQMQIRALKKGLRITELPVRYRKRKAGKSKISATLLGSIQAGYIILRSIFRELLGKT